MAETDAWVARLDPDGELLWRRRFGSDQFDAVKALACDGQGNVYVAGATRGDLVASNAGTSDIFLMKYDADGELLWQWQTGTEIYDTPDRMCLDEDGNIYVAGRRMPFDCRGCDDIREAFIFKFDPEDRREVWRRQWPAIAYSELSSLVLDDNGGCILAYEGKLDDVRHVFRVRCGPDLQVV
ncbi:MAG: hypothetical protein ACYTFO_10000, partial [Planctomycetota bacterium]